MWAIMKLLMFLAKQFAFRLFEKTLLEAGDDEVQVMNKVFKSL
jgi:hypothetical protein